MAKKKAKKQKKISYKELERAYEAMLGSYTALLRSYDALMSQYKNTDDLKNYWATCYIKKCEDLDNAKIKLDTAHKFIQTILKGATE